MATHEIVELSSFSFSFSFSKFSWKIKNLAKVTYKGLESDAFSVGGFKWKVIIYAKGNGVNDYLSLYLKPVDFSRSFFAKFSVVIGTQTHCNNNRVRKEATFDYKNSCSSGWPRFMRLSELHDPAEGYIVNDTCIIAVEVSCWPKEDSTGDNIKERDLDKVQESEANKRAKLSHGVSCTVLGEYPSAGQPFGDGQHNCTVGFGVDKEYEDVGGFSILKTQVPIYKKIWLKYGHIPTNKVMPISSYALIVMAVKDLMSSLIAMQQCRYVDLSAEMIERWDQMLNMAEAVKFNIGWLRERLDIVKKGLGGMQKVKTELLEHGPPLRAAKSRVKAAGDELKKAEAQLIVAKDYLRENASGLLSESDMEMYLDIGEDLLFDGLF